MKLTPFLAVIISMIFTLVMVFIMKVANDKVYIIRDYKAEAITGGAHQHHDYQFDIRGDTLSLYSENEQIGVAIDSTIWKTQLGTLIVKDNH